MRGVFSFYHHPSYEWRVHCPICDVTISLESVNDRDRVKREHVRSESHVAILAERRWARKGVRLY